MPDSKKMDVAESLSKIAESLEKIIPIFERIEEKVVTSGAQKKTKE
jgi:hypothetical protein